jgi:hypothetical protein
MFKAEDLAAWLEANGAPEGTVYKYHNTPMSPDEVVTITPVPSPYTMQAEGDLERQTVQIRTRSPRNGAGEERELIGALDKILNNWRLYPYINESGLYVLTCRRLGGPPTYMRTDQQHRSEFVCNYLLTLEA